MEKVSHALVAQPGDVTAVQANPQSEIILPVDAEPVKSSSITYEVTFSQNLLSTPIFSRYPH